VYTRVSMHDLVLQLIPASHRVLLLLGYIHIPSSILQGTLLMLVRHHAVGNSTARTKLIHLTRVQSGLLEESFLCFGAHPLQTLRNCQ
jgi:hypothetical protein